MEKSTARILKSSDVRLDGTFHLENNLQQQQPQKPKNSASVPIQARIVESQPQFAVIEVICSCGTKTHIRCEYKAPAASQ
ncbi:MAG: hypothetical protein A2Y10_16225 [Planctomycetes bacterium GWF2_41_51]|nr:MAG: hypothetical protein A2Y10_16225 [Planctomycetes bacterium GWF2_41_51]HBG26581.1 hypothetical protein [Phycisphaerales bacterium]